MQPLTGHSFHIFYFLSRHSRLYFFSELPFEESPPSVPFVPFFHPLPLRFPLSASSFRFRHSIQSQMAYIIPCAIAANSPVSQQRPTCYGPVWRHPSSSVHRQTPYLFPVYSSPGPPSPPPPPPPCDSSRRKPDPPGSSPSFPSLAALWRSYNGYLTTAPLLTKSLSASVLVFLSDVCAQALTQSKDLPRLARFALYGLILAGPMGHYWFLTLDRLVTLSGPSGVLLKVIVDQLTFAPFATALFFAVMKTAEGFSFPDLSHFFATNFKEAMLSNYKLWPLANAVNFAFVPPSHRVIFTSAVSILWISFLSVVANRTVSTVQTQPS